MKKTISLLLVLCLVMSTLTGCELSDEQVLAIKEALVDEAQQQLNEEIKGTYLETLLVILQSDGQLHLPKTPEIRDLEFFRSTLGNEVLTVKVSHDTGFLLNHYTTYEITIEENGQQTYSYTLPATLCKGHGFFGYCTGELASMEAVCGKSEDLQDLYGYFTDVTGWLAYQKLITNSLSDEELQALLIGDMIDTVLESKCEDIAMEMVGGMVDELISFNDVAEQMMELKDKVNTAVEDRVGLAETQNMAFYYVPMLKTLVRGFRQSVTPITVAHLKANLQLLGYEESEWVNWKSKSKLMLDEREVELRVQDSQIQWRYKGEGKKDWKLREADDYFAKDGLLVELRMQDDTVQYRVLLNVEHVLHDAQRALHEEVKRLAAAG